MSFDARFALTLLAEKLAHTRSTPVAFLRGLSRQIETGGTQGTRAVRTYAHQRVLAYPRPFDALRDAGGLCKRTRRGSRGRVASVRVHGPPFRRKQRGCPGGAAGRRQRGLREAKVSALVLAIASLSLACSGLDAAGPSTTTDPTAPSRTDGDAGLDAAAPTQAPCDVLAAPTETPRSAAAFEFGFTRTPKWVGLSGPELLRLYRGCKAP